jgi:heme-degrading monooxygenase HmoA
MRIAIAALGLAVLFAIHHSEAGASGPAIARVWHGRVSAGKADEYAKYLAESIKKFGAIPGNRGYQMMREDAGSEAHFMVISFWNSRDAIHAYAGSDISKVRSLPRDGEFLIQPEATVRNYDLLVNELQR